MPRPRALRRLAGPALLLALALPAAAAPAAPRARGAAPATMSLGSPASCLGALVEKWVFGWAMKYGSSADPNGTTINTDHGCSADPNGQCNPASGTTINTDHGCGMDPNGLCL